MIHAIIIHLQGKFPHCSLVLTASYESVLPLWKTTKKNDDASLAVASFSKSAEIVLPLRAECMFWGPDSHSLARSISMRLSGGVFFVRRGCTHICAAFVGKRTEKVSCGRWAASGSVWYGV